MNACYMKYDSFACELYNYNCIHKQSKGGLQETFELGK